MVFALDGWLNRNRESREVARRILNFTFATFQSGVRRNPEHPAFGLIAWGAYARAWAVANYGDDDARVILSTMVTAACLGSNQWDANLMRALLANLRTTGPEGFRVDRVDMPEIERLGWKYYRDTSRTNFSPHFESYLWACYLWAYHHTGYEPFLRARRP